jgi:putative nucleotidyltransferase with HDIG domain
VAHDAPTAQHGFRVAGYAVRVAAAAGAGTDLNVIRLAGLLHDVGKIAVPDRILSAPRPLSEAELRNVRRHPETGYRMLRCCEQLKPMATLVRSHHERWDGSGYGRRLQGEEIPLGSRILALADAFDAMTSERAYRRRIERDEALANIKTGAGTQFDPHLTGVFLEVAANFGDDLLAGTRAIA